MVGAAIAGRVLIVDDVITAGTAIRESVQIIRAAGAEPVGVVIALDRQERGQGSVSAVEEVQQQFELRVSSIVTLKHLLQYLRLGADNAERVAAIERHQAAYGV